MFVSIVFIHFSNTECVFSSAFFLLIVIIIECMNVSPLWTCCSIFLSVCVLAEQARHYLKLFPVESGFDGSTMSPGTTTAIDAVLAQEVAAVSWVPDFATIISLVGRFHPRV